MWVNDANEKERDRMHVYIHEPTSLQRCYL